MPDIKLEEIRYFQIILYKINSKTFRKSKNVLRNVKKVKELKRIKASVMQEGNIEFDRKRMTVYQSKVQALNHKI